MSVRIKFVISDKAAVSQNMLLAVGLILVVLGAVLFTYLSYSLGVQLDVMEWMKYFLCRISNGSWCDDDTKVEMSVNNLKNAINYVCGENTGSIDYGSCGGSGDNAACTMYFQLPQPVSGIEAWIPGAGDPKYLVYHEAFPPGEDTAWSGWQTVSIALMAVPVLKSFGGAAKAGLTSGFIVGSSEQISAASQTLASGGEVATAATRYALNEKVLEGIRAGSIKISAGMTASEAAKFFMSTIEKYIPCDSNTLCVKSAFTVRDVEGQQFPAAKPVRLSDACKDVYIELDKQWQYGTKFYLASPCNAQLEISWGECNCFPEKVQLLEKDMVVCSQDSQYKNYKSKCIKIKPRAISGVGDNFCYTPPKIFGYIATGVSWVSDIGLYYICPTATAAGGVPGLVCYAASGAGKIIAMGLEVHTAWPHGFLEAEQKIE